jgi:hypothetical protein
MSSQVGERAYWSQQGMEISTDQKVGGSSPSERASQVTGPFSVFAPPSEAAWEPGWERSADNEADSRITNGA